MKRITIFICIALAGIACAGDIHLNDNQKLILGTDSDFSLAFTGTLLELRNAATTLLASITTAGSITGINVDGGSIDGTPVGAATPSTGRFSSVESTGLVSCPASTTARESLYIPPGTAPEAPSEGMVWTTTEGFFYKAAAGVLSMGGGTAGGDSYWNRASGTPGTVKPLTDTDDVEVPKGILKAGKAGVHGGTINAYGSTTTAGGRLTGVGDSSTLQISHE